MTTRRPTSCAPSPTIFALLVALVALVASGCGGGEDESTRSAEEIARLEEAGAAENLASLTLEQLRNTGYPLLGVEPQIEVLLSDGEFVDEEDHTRAILGENWISRGDLDGDGREDVAVVLYFDTGGSGNFREFLAFTAVEGEPALLGGVFVGDRQRIQAFGIIDQALVVEMLTHAPEDPMCCPTLRVSDRYVLRNGELVRVSREELPNPSR